MIEKVKRNNTSLILTCIALTVLLVGFMYNFYGYIQEQEHKSRRVQIQEVTERLSQITDAVVKHRFSNVKTYAGLLQIKEADTKENIIRELQRLSVGVKDDDVWMGVVDNRGHFYSSEGRSGRWKDFTMLIKKAPQNQVAIMKMTGHGNQQYMLFLHRLEEPLKFSKGEIKYFGTAMNMAQLQGSLTSASFKDSMLTFIVNHKGQRIYVQGKDEKKLDAFNLFDSLGKYKAVAGDTIADLRAKTNHNKAGITLLDINGVNYDICSVPLKVAPWSMLVVLPQSVLSGEEGLINGLVARLGFIGLVLLVLGVLVMKQRGNSEKQRILEQALIDVEKANEALEESAAENEAQLEEITTQYEMISTAAKVYNVIYYIDLKDHSYIEVSSQFAKVDEYIAARGNADESFEMFYKHLLLPGYEATMREFCDLDTIDERLLGKTYITREYKGVVNGWSQGVFIAGDRDEKGRLRHVYWATRDNNDIKEKELAQTKRLEDALEAAEAANEAKTTFLNNMSHDIRTPMNAILGFTKLMEKELNNPKVAADYLKKIHYSGEYLLTIINNILDMARIESGRTTVDEELIDLEESQGAVVAVFEAEAKNKGISLNHDWHIQHRYVYADYAKCQQIAVNLISNAIKYTPNGGSVNVTVEELAYEKLGYTNFCFTVADTGIGMSKEYQKELFEAFSRERNTTHSKVVGTGLGMAIVKKLVDLLEGTITVDSETGKGSTFKVVIPLKIAEAPEKYISRYEEAVLADIDFAGKRILLAEDNELNAEIAIAILEEDGFVIEHAEDGVACVDMLNRKPAGYYDLILMDIQMPNLNGYDAANNIRKFADKAKANIPILAMTANAFDEDKEKAFSAGMDGFCTKPIDIQQLHKELARVLK